MIYVLFEEGPNGTYRSVFDTLAEAEERLLRLKEYWSVLVEGNKVPERKYYIKTFEEMGV